MFESCINDQINIWQRQIVFWAGLIEVSKVNTYSPLLSFLGGEDNVGQSIQIMRLPDNIGSNELDYFILYDFQVFWGELSSLLAN